MTYGDPGGAEIPQPESPIGRAGWRGWSSMMTRARIGMLIGVAAVVIAPPAVVSLDRVSHQVISAARQIDPARVEKGGDLPQVGASANARQTQNSTPTSSVDGDAHNQITAVLTQQSAALLNGDLPGYLAATDPANAALRAGMTTRFNSLRAMRVVNWDQTIAGRVTASAGGAWDAPVQLHYCFVVATCTPVTIVVDTRWQIAGKQIQLTLFGSSTADQVGPRPWEVSDLQAVVGNRVVVAGMKKWANRLAGILAAAERAAAVTDRYAKWGDPPTRYIVYVAGPDEWAQWYGVQQAGWVAAYAMPLTDTYTEIVLNATKVAVSDAREVLQHEFTHVVTLSGVHKTYPESWWLIEGIAEYVQNVGAPISMYRALGDGRKYVHGGTWNGAVALGEPDANASTSDANGRYAVAYLAVRRLAERFGEPKMLDFFNAVARNGQAPDQASAAVFGQPWAAVADDCAKYVRRSVG